MASLTIQNLNKDFNETHVLKDINLDIHQGEFFSLVGPSGCGKTTLLRIIAGLEVPTSGKVTVNNIDFTNLPPQKRNIGIVFQNYALFPHMTVFENAAYGLRVKKLSKEEINKKVSEVLEKVRLGHKAGERVTKLSGGEQQRVSLARVIVMEPRLILFDEPLSNLDYALRIQTRGEIKRLQKDIGITSVYVTHDQSEALALSDRIAVMNKGVIQHTGTPHEVYFNPANIFTAEFVGHANLFTADEAKSLFNIEDIAQNRKLAVLPEELTVNEDAAGHNLADVQFNGFSVEYLVSLNGRVVKSLMASKDTDRILAAGSKVSLSLISNYSQRVLSE
jgi:iron(III) transport system ATP-binding protein